VHRDRQNFPPIVERCQQPDIGQRAGRSADNFKVGTKVRQSFAQLADGRLRTGGPMARE
jgi:hypothetical protein